MNILNKVPDHSSEILYKTDFNSKLIDVLGLSIKEVREMPILSGDVLYHKLIPVKVYLTYPFTKVVQIDGYVKDPRLLIWNIAKAYEKIYRRGSKEEDVGIWGHVIGDLYFERMTVYSDGTVLLFIGS